MERLSSNYQGTNADYNDTKQAVTAPSTYGHGVADARQVQRVWRIGTYSMGITLIGIGCAFGASLWQTATSYELLLWLAPIVFIILGVEMMLAHSSKLASRYKIEYNWLGMLFVGFVGAGALILSALLSSGLLEEVNQLFSVKERSVYIEEKVHITDQAIDKLVIKGDLKYEIQKQDSVENEVSLLGLVHYESKEPAKLSDNQLLKAKQVGSVLYIFIQNLEYDSNLLAPTYTRSQLVLSVPERLTIQ